MVSLHVVNKFQICTCGLSKKSYSELLCMIPYIEKQNKNSLKVHLSIEFTRGQIFSDVHSSTSKKALH